MNIGLLLNLLLAHLMGDFALQTSKSCKHKRDKKWGSVYHYFMHKRTPLGPWRDRSRNRFR